ncbi:MAG TPA: hypothetical protein VGD27_03275 [Longimicrobiales bacterium]
MARKRKQKTSKSTSLRKAAGKARTNKQATAIETPELDVAVDHVGPTLTLERGPRKQTTQGPAPIRLTTHKTRAKWFQSRAAWPVREAPVGTVVNERSRARKTTRPAAGTGLWESVGPTNIGGRVTSIVCDPKRPERLWIGAAGGGVWYSPDAGNTWTPQWHDQDVLTIGSLALDPIDPNIIYCGTGEANLSADAYAGVGVYQSVDGGRTWHLLAEAGADVPRRIGAIAVDPFDRQHICLGGVGFGEVGIGADLGGLYVSRDGGVSWQRETFVTTGNYWCHALLFHPTKRGVAYAAITERGTRNGIYRTINDGASWVQLSKGLPDTARTGRASLALCASRPNVLYAYIRDEWSGSADRVLGVYRSNDNGNTWRDVSGRHFEREGQTSYNNTIVVHPQDPNHVLCGGVDLHKTVDGGKTWRRVTRWNSERGRKNYAHADHHGLLMPTAAPGRVYDVNDGGLDVSEDGGDNWANRSRGLAITMYYDLDVAHTDGRVFGGGAQDNGTLITTNGRSDDHYELLGGDGGWIVWDPSDASRVYASYYNLNIFRFEGDDWKDVSPTDDEDEKSEVWMAYITIDPKQPRTLFTASRRVWRTLNRGDSWRAVSPVLDGSAITAIEVALADSRRIYVGTENGSVFRSDDGGNSWTPNLASATLPGYSITRLRTQPNNANVVYATIANFGHSHVFRSRDGARNWEDVDRGQLPNVPHNSITIPRAEPETLYVCNDAGVFVTYDGGASWLSLTRNLPRVMVIDLVHHERDGTLSAATYGRSIWRLKLG